MNKYVILHLALVFSHELFALEIEGKQFDSKIGKSEIRYLKDRINKSKLNSSSLKLDSFDKEGCAEGMEIGFGVIAKEPFVFLGNKISRGTRFIFCGGDLSWMQLANDDLFKVSGITCQGQVDFYSYDQFCQCQVGADSVFKSLKIKKDSRVILDEKGDLFRYFPTTSYHDEKFRFKFEQGKRYTLTDGKISIVPEPADPNDDRPYSCEITAGLSRDRAKQN